GTDRLHVLAIAPDSIVRERYWNGVAWSGFRAVGQDQFVAFPLLSPVAVSSSSLAVCRPRPTATISGDTDYIYYNGGADTWDDFWGVTDLGIVDSAVDDSVGYGAIGVDAWNGQYDVAWANTSITMPNASHSYGVRHVSGPGQMSANRLVGGIWASPPTIAHAPDGSTEVLGIGTDGCL